MAITKPARRSKVDAFTAAAPDARPARKLRGRKAPISFTLPPDLIDAVDTIAATEDRSRAKMIELVLRRWVAEHTAAAQGEGGLSDYDTDLVMWSERQAQLLRRMAAGEHINDQIDWENLAEEIEALAKSQRRELRNRVGTILFHLIKLQASPSAQPRAGWIDTVTEQQKRLRRLIKDSPALRSDRPDEPGLPAVITEELAEAKALAATSLANHHEEATDGLSGLEYTEEQVLGPWVPPSSNGAA